jgi:myo-inositol 2-dehydrogenase / D-chiro-inositol 1-dehydrogenase
MGKTSKIKFGSVGLGRLGYKHAENLAERIPNADLISICDIDQQKLAQVESKWSLSSTYTDFKEMIDKANLDAVLISSPSKYHCEQIEYALNAGVHVFCEKPLGVSMEECHLAEKAVENHPELVFMLGFMRRYDPSYLYVKKAIVEGKIGTPILYRGYSVDPESAIEGAIKYAAHSAGQFIDMAIHDIDLARWILKSEPKEVYAIGGCYAHPEFGKYGDGDNVGALFKFENNAMAFLFAGRTAPHGYNIETEIIGTKATLRVGSVPQSNLVEILDNSGVRKECSQDFIERFDDAYLNEIREFINCIQNKSKPEVTVYDGTVANEIAIAATESFKNSKLMQI